MPADTYESILGLILQGVGNNNNAWGTIHDNSGFKPLARSIAGVNAITQVGGTLDLSTVVPPAGLRLDVDAIQIISSTLTSDLTIIVANASKTWEFWNKSTGAFNVYVKVPGGVAASGPSAPGGLVQIPRGVCITVICDGAGTLLRADDAEIGAFIASGKAAVGPGEIACNGASYLKTALPDLYAKIGTVWGSVDGTHFNVPNFTDTGRFLRSATGSVTAGTYQANQNLAHTHTITGAPGVGSLSTDSQGSHSHTINIGDPSHAHSTNAVAGTNTTGGGGFFCGNNTGATINGAFTGISASATTAGAHTHNVTGAPSVGSLATASQGGTEARPEAAVCTIAIRY
jgi:hypothetical protein